MVTRGRSSVGVCLVNLMCWCLLVKSYVVVSVLLIFMLLYLVCYILCAASVWIKKIPLVVTRGRSSVGVCLVNIMCWCLFDKSYVLVFVW